MALVDYGSDSDESDAPVAEIQQKAKVVPARGSVEKGQSALLKVGKLKNEENRTNQKEAAPQPIDESRSISSFLPAPTNRLKKQREERKSRASGQSVASPATNKPARMLGGAIRPEFDGDFGVSMDYEPARRTSPPPLKRSKIVPAAVAARQAKSDQKSFETTSQELPKHNAVIAGPSLPSLFSYDSHPDRDEPQQQIQAYEPVIVEQTARKEDMEHPTATELVPPEPKNHTPSTNPLSQYESKRARQKLGDKDIEVTDFSVDEFYKDNERLREAGELEDNRRPVYAVGSGRHQLSTLIQSAQQNREQLEAKISEGKRNRHESGKKYGF